MPAVLKASDFHLALVAAAAHHRTVIGMKTHDKPPATSITAPAASESAKRIQRWIGSPEELLAALEQPRSRCVPVIARPVPVVTS